MDEVEWKCSEDLKRELLDGLQPQRAPLTFTSRRHSGVLDNKLQFRTHVYPMAERKYKGEI
jgi:hypothetical protein